MTVIKAAAVAAGLLFFSTGGLTMTVSGQDLLKVHQWDHRLLLLFYPKPNDPRAEAIKQNIAGLACGLEERDLLFADLPMNSKPRFADAVVPARAATAIRQHFRVGDREFAVVLVGKDGGEKLRLHEIPDIDAIFDLIDGMPMRMAEMRERSGRCAG